MKNQFFSKKVFFSILKGTFKNTFLIISYTYSKKGKKMEQKSAKTKVSYSVDTVVLKKFNELAKKKGIE